MRILFLGTPDFAVPSLQALLASQHEVVGVVAQPDRPSGRGMKLHKPPVAQLALERKLPLFQPPKLDAEFLVRVGELEPELGVVVAYGRILRRSLLDLPKHGFINVHGSLLPKYRGAAPIQRAVEAGDRETGVTIMRVDEELDHGDIFVARTIPIEPHEGVETLFEKLAKVGGELLVEVVNAIAEGRAVAVEQDHDAATAAPKISKAEGRVDWSLTAQRLYDRFRAFHPWPGLFVTISDEVVKLAEVVPASPKPAASGEIIAVNRESIVVACGEGTALEVRMMQRPGKKAAHAADVARGIGLTAGSRLP